MDIVILNNFFLKVCQFIKLFIINAILSLNLNFITANATELSSINNITARVPNIDAEAYVLMDYDSGKILAEKNADVRRDTASLTKMMTTYVIGQSIKSGKIHLNDIVTIDKDAWATGNPLFKGSSLMFLKPGDRVPVSQLNRGIALQSGNDACVAIADYIAGSQDAFVDLMNYYVKVIGLQNTHFKNVHGLDAKGQFSTARDMAVIGRRLIHDVPDTYAVYHEKEFTFNNIRQINRNGLLWDTNLNVDGIKTGHTEASGYNLVASAKKGNMRLISSIMGGHTYKGREIETKKLLTWGFRFFETVIPLKAGQAFTLEPVWFANIDKVKLGVTKNIYLTIPRGHIKDLKASYILTNSELRAPLKKNQIVGMIYFYLGDKIIDKCPLLVLKEIQKGNIFNQMIDYIRLIFHRWFG